MIPRLKSLELHGYKTFAAKTRFEYPGQITAIVGPNGSGKSNIADAIRWVLGEQAYSMLRGKKTVDMIYSGSETRPRSSMAASSITFNNDDGWLPIDYSEVTLTRRAYRSGENEYLLNGQRVRLKEINELLANSGLAERTYTLIGQGLVDTALSLRPDERRRFFEEAAGIGLYRSRRDEAIQKLDTTLRNMERAEDILGELKPRLTTLARQAEKAREYESLHSDLSMLLREWYGYHWHNAQKDLSEASAFHKQQETQLNELRQKLQSEEATISDSRELLANSRSELTELHHISAKLHAELEEYTREQAVSEERLRSLREKIKNIESRLSSLDELLVDAQLQEEETLKFLEFSRKEHDNNRIEEERISQEQEKFQKEIDELTYSLQILTKQTDEKIALLSFLETEVHHHNTRLKELNEDLEKVKADQQQDSEKLIKLEEEYLQALDLVKKHQENLKTNQEKAEKTVSERQSIEDKKRDAEQNLSEIQREKNGLTARYEIFEQAEKTHNGYITGTKLLLEKLNVGNRLEKINALLKHIEVEPKYEQAIAAVLGDSLEGLLITKKDLLFEALDQIARHENIRTILLPVETMRLKHTSNNDPQNPGLKTAIEVVRADEQVLKVIKVLLQDVFIVDSIEEGLALQARSTSDTFVSLNGEVLLSTGVIIAGKEMRVKTISRQREQREIILKLQQLNQQVEKINQNIHKFENEIKILQAEEESDRKKVINSRSVLFDAETALREKSGILEQTRAILNYHKKREAENIKLKESIQQKVEKESKKIEEEQKILEERRREADSLQEKIKLIPIENIRQKWVVISTAMAVSKEAIRNAEIRHQEKLETRVKLEKERAESVEVLNVAVTNFHDEQDAIERLRQNIQSHNQELDVLKGKSKPIENLIENASENQNHLLQAIEEMRREFNIQERHTLQAQLCMSRLRENLDDLRKKIEEDLGFIELEFADKQSGPKPLPIDGWVASLTLKKEISPDIEDQIKQKKGMMRRLGPINPEAYSEFLEVSERTAMMEEQLTDLKKADQDLRKVVSELDDLMTQEFNKTFKAVESEFKQIFTQLFNGGSARLIIEDEENVTETGIEIEATLPGRRKQELALLSGGERSLTAVALIFALLKISPTPFCVLDEVDAMLDESNVMRFGQLMRSLSEKTQFIVITHNRNTVQLADILYGVTMGRDSASQVISLRMDELTDEYVR